MSLALLLVFKIAVFFEYFYAWFFVVLFVIFLLYRLFNVL